MSETLRHGHERSPMKGMMLLAWVLIVATLIPGAQSFAQGSLTMNAGDKYVFQFSSLPLSGTWDMREPPSVPAGRVDGLFVPGSFVVGSSFLAEMFEDSVNDVPIASQTLNSVSDLPAPPGPAFYWSNGAWQDLQGVVRLTMLRGSVSIYSLVVAANRNDAGVFNSYSTSALPVPEPGSVVLFIWGALLAVCYRRRLSLLSH